MRVGVWGGPSSFWASPCWWRCWSMDRLDGMDFELYGRAGGMASKAGACGGCEGRKKGVRCGSAMPFKRIRVWLASAQERGQLRLGGTFRAFSVRLLYAPAATRTRTTARNARERRALLGVSVDSWGIERAKISKGQ